LTPGQQGDAVRDLQRRLAAAGFPTTGDEAGVFDAATHQMVESFQRARGLHASGICDEATWLALVEAGWTLGDRLLVLRAPHLRGDDVAEMQTVLNHLGFDCGRPDGILGPATARALEDFQRNSGLRVDGVCGVHTVRMLDVVRRQSGDGPGVAHVRERESIAAHRSLAAMRIVVGQFGGMSAVTRSLARALRHAGAVVMSTDEYDPAAHAAAANRFGAAVYVGFELRTDARSMITYFAVPSFESVGGRTLAAQAARELAVIGRPPDLLGMRLAVLRETRMPAILCSLGPVREIVDSSDAIAAAMVRALERWATAPTVDTERSPSPG
jgi:N-acetylmuramoyl-L-alanine amidase